MPLSFLAFPACHIQTTFRSSRHHLSLSPPCSLSKHALLRSHFFLSPQSPLRLTFFTNPTRHGKHEHKLGCASPSQDLWGEMEEEETQNAHEVIQSISLQNEENLVVESVDSGGGGEVLANQSIWNQIVEIIKFCGPATGLWLCGPLMSLIDTAVIGQTSSIELAALGPGTVLCDYISYVFTFLSIATSNMVATSLAREDENEVQRQISILLFVGLTCGSLMFLFTKFFGVHALTAFTGVKNMHLVPVANIYVQIRCIEWPFVLVGWVAQSASLGMKDSWGPLKALAVACIVNIIGDVVLCLIFNCGIAGAACATATAQIVAGLMMIHSLNKKGYNAYAISVPSVGELLQIFVLATPVLITIASKVAFYALLIHSATSMGTTTGAAHQVMLQTFSLFAVCSEPLSQTSQSFMPELVYGVNRNMSKARMLLKSLLVIGASCGLILGIAGTVIPWLFPKIFTPDPEIIIKMHRVLIPYFLVLAITPSMLCCEGTLLAGRDLKFISLSMTGCFAFGSLLVLTMNGRGVGLVGCWSALVVFQWARFFMALRRLLSRDGFLFSENIERYDELVEGKSFIESVD